MLAVAEGRPNARELEAEDHREAADRVREPGQQPLRLLEGVVHREPVSAAKRCAGARRIREQARDIVLEAGVGDDAACLRGEGVRKRPRADLRGEQ